MDVRTFQDFLGKAAKLISAPGDKEMVLKVGDDLYDIEDVQLGQRVDGTSASGAFVIEAKKAPLGKAKKNG